MTKNFTKCKFATKKSNRKIFSLQFHTLLMFKMPHLLDNSGIGPSQQLSALTIKLMCCLEHHDIARVPPSVLAAALLSIQLETLQIRFLPITVWLQTLAQCNNDSLIHCREELSRLLAVPRTLVPGLGAVPPPPTAAVTPSSGAIKRKVEQMELDKADDDDDNIYDGIKRLYSEDLEPVTLTRVSSCGRHLQQLAIISPARLAALAN